MLQLLQLLQMLQLLQTFFRRLVPTLDPDLVLIRSLYDTFGALRPTALQSNIFTALSQPPYNSSYAGMSSRKTYPFVS